jgi:hypothetical protein
MNVNEISHNEALYWRRFLSLKNASRKYVYNLEFVSEIYREFSQASSAIFTRICVGSLLAELSVFRFMNAPQYDGK